jgi:RNA recognition motif-containing protein
MEGDTPPNQTLYVNNLNEKIKKFQLKQTLLSVFSQFGRVVDIVACKGIRLRGQAWVVFEDVAAATNAMRRLQGFNFFDKPLRIQFAKEKSDTIAKREGTYNPSVKRKREEAKQQAEEALRVRQNQAAAAGPAFWPLWPSSSLGNREDLSDSLSQHFQHSQTHQIFFPSWSQSTMAKFPQMFNNKSNNFCLKWSQLVVVSHCQLFNKLSTLSKLN